MQTVTAPEAMSLDAYIEFNRHQNAYRLESWENETKLRAKAEKDLKLFEARLVEFNSAPGPKVGEAIRLPDGSLHCFTHNWGDSLQTSKGRGYFYLYGTSASYSGSLDPSIPIEFIEATDEKAPTIFWLFSGNEAKAHNGVDYRAAVAVYKLKAIDRIDKIREVPYQVKVVEVTADVYDYALNVLPPIYWKRSFFGMGEAHSHKGAVPVYYFFIQIRDKYYCTIGTLDEAKARFCRVSLTRP